MFEENRSGESPEQAVHPTAETENNRPYPKLRFQVSEKDKDQPFRQLLEEATAAIVPVWEQVEEPVLSAFEEVCNKKWRSDLQGREIPVTMSATERSYSSIRGKNIQLGVRDKSRLAIEQGRMDEARDTESLVGSLVHELGHQFISGSDVEFVKANFAERVPGDTPDDEKLTEICTETCVELVWKEVVDRTFPPEKVSQWLERRKGEYTGVYDIIDTLSEDERRLIVDRDYRRQVQEASSREHSGSRVASVRNFLSQLARKARK